MAVSRKGTFLTRARPPRVAMTYEVEVGAAVELRELPFVVGVLGDFSGQPVEPLPRLRDRKFVQIDADNFDSVLTGMRPRVAFMVPNRLTDDGSMLKVELTFRRLEDFEPHLVARQIEPLDRLLKYRIGLVDLQVAISADEKLDASLWEALTHGLTPTMVTGPEGAPVAVSGGAIDGPMAERHGDAIKQLLESGAAGTVQLGRDLQATIVASVSILDELLSKQLTEVMHHPDFQQVEGSWRALMYLVRNTATGPNLKIKVLNVSKRDLLRDLQRASEFDQSSLFKKVYDEEYGVFGGEPYAVLIGNYEISNLPADIELLEHMSAIAASSHAPFITAAAPELLNLTSFAQLGLPRDLAKIFDSTDYSKWKSFRQSEDARYVAMVLPRMLMRLPYGRHSSPSTEFDFEEGVWGYDDSQYLWANAAFALAARLTNAFATYGWSAAIRGIEGGGVVSDLPVHPFRTDDGETVTKCPTEIAITDRRERELAELGFMPLVHCKGTDFACFFSARTVQKPPVYEQPELTASARAMSQLPYVLSVSRFAHYLKAMMRDKVGSFATRAEAETYLQNWLAQFVTSDDNASQSTKARYPLQQARIEVSERRDKPGRYVAVAFLLPNFQLEPLSVPLRVVMELPQALY